MDLILKSSGGQNIVLRPQARAAWYPHAEVEAASVDVYWRLLDDDGIVLGAWQLLGNFPPRSAVAIAYNAEEDSLVEVSSVSVSAAGVRSVSTPDHGNRSVIPVGKNAEAPRIGQIEAATVSTIVIGVTGYTRMPRLRRVRVYADEALTELLRETIYDASTYTSRRLPDRINISREAGEDPLPQTIHITVEHGGALVYGPQSNALSVTFAGASGGGSGGGFETEPPPDDLPIGLDPL